MRNTGASNRKCSALLALGAGAAVCLSGGTTYAVSGTAGNDIAAGASATELGGKIECRNFGGVLLEFIGVHNTIMAGIGSINIRRLGTYSAQQACSTASNWWEESVSVTEYAGDPSKYIKIRFNDGAAKYGWSQFELSGTTFKFGAWGYSTSASVKTLADSINRCKLGLANGRETLYWANENEDGIARYEVQAKDASGVWKAIDSSTPGEGHYAATVAEGSQCRLVVEKVDGATQEFTF